MSDTPAIAAIDAVIADLEEERRHLLSLLAVAHGPVVETLAVGLKQVADKLDEVRAKRQELVRRVVRTERMTALAAEMRALRAELEGLDEGDSEARNALRLRAARLTEEAQKLREDT
jgi:hypothetical protein